MGDQKQVDGAGAPVDLEVLVARAHAAKTRAGTARALAAKATPGPLDVIPWPGERGPGGGWGVCEVETLIVRSHAPVRASKEDDAAFFADARTSLPEICDDTDALADGVLGLVADNLAMTEEYDRLRARVLSKAIPVFGAFERMDDGNVRVPMRDSAEVGAFLFGTLAGLLEGKGGGTRARNYLELCGHHPVIGGITVTIQRIGAVTPHGGRAAAEEALARAVALLAEHGIPWDGPTTFEPPPPEALPAPETGPTPWVIFDVDVQPNQAWCQRCGVRQDVPDQKTAGVLRGILAGFTADHLLCEDGDAELTEEARIFAGLEEGTGR